MHFIFLATLRSGFGYGDDGRQMKSHQKKMFRIKGAVIAALSIYASGAFLFSSAQAESPREDQTRYGVASGSGPLNTLLINGHPTAPRIAGNSALFVAKIAEAWPPTSCY